MIDFNRVYHGDLVSGTINQEEWREIEGFTFYEVSSYGRVRSLPHKVYGCRGSFTSKTRLLKIRLNRKGYCMVSLSKDGKVKLFSVHRLVAMAFLQNPNNLPEVNHIDEDKTNNKVENLEWCTHIENSRHGTRISRIRETLLKKHHCFVAIKQYTKEGVFIKEYVSLSTATRETKINNIVGCLKGRTKQAGGFVWTYADKTFEEWKKDIYPHFVGYKRAVQQFSKEGMFMKEYDSISQAGRYNNIRHNGITLCCLGKLKTSGGYIWKYKK